MSKPRPIMHQWVKFGMGRVEKACLLCGLVQKVAGSQQSRIGQYPIYSYRRDNLDFGIQKNMPPCAPRFQFDRAPPVTFSLGGYDFSVKKSLRDVQPISAQKIPEPESKSPETET